MLTLKKLREDWEWTGINPEIYLDEICNILKLTEDNKYTRYGVAVFLDEFIKNNETNIKLLMNHPSYNKNLQIVMNNAFFDERKIVPSKINSKLYDFLSEIDARESVVTKTDGDGKSVSSYLALENEKMFVNIFEVMENDLSLPFNMRDEYIPSVEKYATLKNIVGTFRSIYTETLSEENAIILNSYNETFRFQAGMKTTRAFNKVFKAYGFNDNERGKYSLGFREYSDLLSPLSRCIPIVISLNPIDFITMSFGNSWASCHTVDGQNRRKIRITDGGADNENTFQGCFRGGTLSYALDSVSFVVYTMSPNGNLERPELDAWEYGKWSRNMFHYKDGILLQGRIYPQATDGCQEEYKKRRVIMQDAICKMLGVENIADGTSNDSWAKIGESYRNDSYYETEGCHYPDYEKSSTKYTGCNLSKLKSVYNSETYIPMTIGHDGIDFVGGETFTCRERLYNYCSTPRELTEE